MSCIAFFKALVLPLGELAGCLKAGLQPGASGQILSDSAAIFFLQPPGLRTTALPLPDSWVLSARQISKKEFPPVL